MTLPPELAQAFRTNLHRFEEDKKVEFISSVERMAIEEGLQKGDNTPLLIYDGDCGF
ncbi:MAG: hypothetical protein KF770_32795 [Anaerolineae bacterium]|nr:hypothetical protein [Anaerolineae bacterium]